MSKQESSERQEMIVAENVRKACIRAAREGFQDASMSGLCDEGAMEAAVGAIQSLDLKQVIKDID